MPVEVEVQIHEGQDVIALSDDNESDIEPPSQRPRLQ